MTKILLLLVTSLFTGTCFSQKASGLMRGVLVDSISNEPVGGATVEVFSEKDSSFRSLVISSNDGSFEIKNTAAGTFILIVSHQGLETVRKTFSLFTNKIFVDFGTIKMEKAYKDLGEVIVKDQVPVRINGDTLFYKADAFKTKPNATVEDLLKKLPGVQVDNSGTVKAQGEQVQKVYVDGKEFFGDDPKLATKNLTADMIDQVHVYNDMSEQAKFNGMDDGSRTKTINLKLKKDKKSGMFGKVYGGYGSDNLYTAGIQINSFKGASQFSLIAGANNVNNSVSNIIKAGGTNSGIGITKNSLVGLNYSNTWSRSFDVNGSYGHNHSNTTNLRKSLKQTFLVDSTFITDRATIYNNVNDNHRLNLNLLYTLDSFNSILYAPAFSVQNLQTNSTDTVADYIKKNGSGYKADDSRTMNSSDGCTYTLMNNIIWRKKFHRPGRTLFVNLFNTLNTSKNDGYNVINSKFYNEEGLVYRQRDIAYKTGNAVESNNWGVTLSYTEPVAMNKVLELNYSYNNNGNASDRKAYNYNRVTKLYDELVDTLSNRFGSLNEYNRFGANFKGVNKKYYYQLGLGIQQTLLESRDLSKGIKLSQGFLNLIPAGSFNYKLSKSKNLQVNYRGQSNQPGIAQLQDITDLTNYPNVRKGNPSLKQEFFNNLTLAYNSYNISKLRNLFAYIVYNRTHNKIVSSLQQKAGEQILMPVNLDGVYNISGTFNFGSTVKAFNLNTNTEVAYSRNGNLINGQKNYVNDFSAREEITLSYNYDDKLDVDIDLGVTYNSIGYAVQKELNSSYFTHNYSIDLSYIFPEGITFSTNAEYTAFTGRSGGYNRSYLIWNAYLAKQLFKNSRGELRFSANDILNKSLNITRSVVDNYIEDVENKTLRRFFLLTFTYNLNQMAKKM